MFPETGEYWVATRHPWSCALLVLPLLAIYEFGLHSLGNVPVESFRNGADVWLRTGLAATGISWIYAAPIALVLILLAWTMFYREARPKDAVGVWIGMVAESVIFATALFVIGKAIWPMVNSFSGMLKEQMPNLPALVQPSGYETTLPDHVEPALVNVVRYLGAGIFEETLFRLLCFSGLLTIFSMIELPGRLGMAIAAVASALLFAGAHNFGPNGEPFQGTLFLFRTLAGVYFALLYRLRGFGIAVGAHAGYDLLVGLFVSPPY